MRRFLLMTLAATLAPIGLTSPTMAQTAPPPPPERTNLSVLDAAEGGCTLATIPDGNVSLGEVLVVVNGSSETVTVMQRDGFWSKTLHPGEGNDSTRIRGAGTYLSACVPGDWHAPIRARVQAPGSPSTNSFSVTWAKNAPDAWRFRVQFRIGQGAWTVWRQNTALGSAVFNGQNGKTYFFRAKTKKDDQATDWSPSRRVVT